MFNSKMSNYPGGFANGVIIRGVPLHIAHPGKMYWVYNGTALLQGQRAGSDGNDGSFNAPFSTLDYAVGRCTASRGDVIMVKPGHAETISTAAGVDLDVAGIAVIGLGSGTLMPTFTLSAATADMRINAANVTVYNLRMTASATDVVRAINVNAANASIINCLFPDSGATNEILTAIKATSTTDNNADGLWIEGNRSYGTSTAILEFFEWNAQINGLVLKDNVVINEGTAAGTLAAGATGKDLLNAVIKGNLTSAKLTAGNLLVDSDSTASTGVAMDNMIGHADVTTTHDNGLTGMGFRLFNNLSVSTASLSGFVLPAIDTDA